jgi:hypothetical protein
MNVKTWSYQTSLAIALGGLALIGAGLWLAALSDPGRFTINARDDKWIYGYAGVGFVCTIVGIGLFLVAVHHTTTSLPLETRKKINAALGIGLLFQLAGIVILMGGQGRAPLGGLLVVASLPLFVLGSMYYADGKHYTKQFGLLGLLGTLGLLVLILLPDRDDQGGHSMGQVPAE